MRERRTWPFIKIETNAAGQTRLFLAIRRGQRAAIEEHINRCAGCCRGINRADIYQRATTIEHIIKIHAVLSR